jgi:hypothetical protein
MSVVRSFIKNEEGVIKVNTDRRMGVSPVIIRNTTGHNLLEYNYER